MGKRVEEAVVEIIRWLSPVASQRMLFPGASGVFGPEQSQL
jgi:hypothetical protein